MTVPLSLLIASVTVIFVAGLAILQVAGLRTRYFADFLIAAFALGISALGAAVYILLLADLYSGAAAIVLIGAPTLYLSFEMFRGKAGALLPRERHPLAGLPASWLDLVVALSCLVLVLIALFECLTTPMIFWDAAISWDKWATEWALRTNMSERKLAYYPQLLPMLSSLLYKITGTASDPLPLPHFALHALHPVIGGFLVISIMRLAAVLNVAAWPALLLFFGSSTVSVALKAGGADLLAAALFTFCLTVFLSAIKADISARGSFTILFFLLFFGALFAKANNVAILLIPAVTFLLIHFHGVAGHVFPKGAVFGTGLAIVLFASFLGHQFLNIATPADHMRLDELNFEPAKVSTHLVATTASVVGKNSIAERVVLTADRFLTDYDLPSVLRTPAWGLAIAALLVSINLRMLWPILATATLQVAIWGYFSAYDNRNLIPALPIIGIAIAGGFSVAGTWVLPMSRLRFLLQGAIMLLSLPWILVIGQRLMIESRNNVELVTKQWDIRVKAMAGPLSDRIQTYFPMESAGYNFIRSLRPFRDAKHIMAGYHLYRWLPGGGYPLSAWWMDGLLPGDGVAFLANGLPRSDRRPYYDRLTQVYNDGRQYLYLCDKAPLILTPDKLVFAGATPPRLLSKLSDSTWTVESSGNSGLVAYEVSPENWKEGDSVTWRVLLTGDLPDGASVTSTFLVENPASFDPGRSRMVEDAARTGDKIAAYSGIVTFTGKASGKVMLGLNIQKPGVRIQIKEFRISAYR